MNTINDNREKRPVKAGLIRRCWWFAQPDFVESDASSQANFSGSGEKCIEVNLSGLPKDKREPVWDWIQKNQPGLADMLQNDMPFLAVKEKFSCSVTVELPTSVCKQLGLIR